MAKARKKAKITLAALPTPERLAHAAGAFEVGGDARTGKVMRMTDSPIEQLLASRRISQEQFEALRLLRLHWYLAGLAGALRAVDLNRVRASDWNGMSRNERELMHRNAFNTAWSALDQTQRTVVNTVVLTETGLASAGAELSYLSPYRARQAALEVLKQAADTIAIQWRTR